MSGRSKVVGALACQVNSYLKSLDAIVVSCTELTERDVKEAKSDPNDTKNASLFEVEFNDTILFPEGGGQPSDRGVIIEEGQEIPVLDIQRKHLAAIHRTTKELSPGTGVTLKLDWNRRFDHMQQHSGQHLISAVLDNRNVPTLAWSLGAKFSYVEISRKLTDQEVEEVEDECNQIIRDGLDITVEIPTDNSVNTDKLPDDYDLQNGVLRVVHIGNIDANPCCGTHLRNTREMNSIALLHQVVIRGSNSRLYFLIGDRVRRYEKSLHSLTRTLNSNLSCQTEEIISKTSRLEQQYKESAKREKFWMTELSRIDCTNLIEVATKEGKALLYRSESQAADYLSILAADLGKKSGSNNFDLILLISGTPKNSGSIYIFGKRAAEVSVEIKKIATNVKGGGKGQKWQGKVATWEKNEIEQLKDYFHKF
ncbi:Threonyl/alanyl tRNA synthetase [Lipomyces oligophaga]|uniref:Threonyl/alanyl tRNA synthetase n=1 Tax=Lipomyces oligophaga TaxID=45792 RepID=UPI0034CFE3FE